MNVLVDGAFNRHPDGFSHHHQREPEFDTNFYAVIVDRDVTVNPAAVKPQVFAFPPRFQIELTANFGGNFLDASFGFFGSEMVVTPDNHSITHIAIEPVQW